MSDQPELKDEFTSGYLICLSLLIGAFGNSTEAEHLFREIGSPTAKEVRRLNLCEYDRRNLSEVRKYAK
jgi:hypothetical protein